MYVVEATEFVVLCCSKLQTGEGGQHMPPHNMPLWHDDNFELKAIKKQQTEEELSVLSLPD